MHQRAPSREHLKKYFVYLDAVLYLGSGIIGTGHHL